MSGRSYPRWLLPADPVMNSMAYCGRLSKRLWQVLRMYIGGVPPCTSRMLRIRQSTSGCDSAVVLHFLPGSTAHRAWVGLHKVCREKSKAIMVSPIKHGAKDAQPAISLSIRAGKRQIQLTIFRRCGTVIQFRSRLVSLFRMCPC